ncbi:YtzH-like family protein [Bacillus shivajii]|uniref:YtzH-like family protein n=1 Tax=Bacillus shivajii TaxID=1983719 RepID=UPI001CFB287A|nr:YtzH-like family protein [Bacillus shivajii]UCZ52330.1 YtzH-like family protein [Bacillus shivajii]
MEKAHLIREMISIIDNQERTEKGSERDFQRLVNIIYEFRNDVYNENFQGTLQEIKAYAQKRKESVTLDEHINNHLHHMSRWKEELTLFLNGGGAVTIDYEQRKGREV